MNREQREFANKVDTMLIHNCDGCKDENGRCRFCGGLGSDQPLWVVDAKGTKEHWLQIEDPEGWWRAVVKWDGCIDLNHYGNARYTGDERPEYACDDYIHICDLDAYIERLQAIRAEALKHFGEDWEG